MIFVTWIYDHKLRIFNKVWISNKVIPVLLIKYEYFITIAVPLIIYPFLGGTILTKLFISVISVIFYKIVQNIWNRILNFSIFSFFGHGAYRYMCLKKVNDINFCLPISQSPISTGIVIYRLLYIDYIFLCKTK